MNEIISMKNVSKQFKVLNRREGLKGSIKDLVSRDYSYVKAVNNVSLDIGRGEIVGYLGPNGAGKSTTIKMMTGILEPTEGEILVNGKIPYKNRTKNAQNIGVVFGQRSQLWWSLPLIESFKLLKDMYRIPEDQYNDMLDFYNNIVNIKELYHKPVRQMSLGQRTLSDILAAFLHNPAVVFLDEPTIGLDVSMKSKIRDLIKALNEARNTTVILTTHDMGDVDALCQRIVIIDKGSKLYDDSIENLKNFFGHFRTLEIKFHKSSEEISEEEQAKNVSELTDYLRNSTTFADAVSITGQKEYIDILVDEEKVQLMKVLNSIQDFRKVRDVNMQEISTESVIKKIYEGGI